MMQEALAAAKYISQRTKIRPAVGVILGTGLGTLTKKIKINKTFEYEELPDFCASTAESHKGRFIIGRLANKRVAVMQGRLHFYEGYSAAQICLPIRVMKLLGIKNLVVSNASGGLDPDFTPGDIMVINDHINLIPDNPLRGKNDDRAGPRFPDMYDCYDKQLIQITEGIALKNGISIKKGVYAAVSGPNFETKAEYRFLRMIGADAVGMSTVPEVLMARYLKIRVLGLSIITDMGIADALKPVSVKRVINTAQRAEPGLAKIIAGVVKEL
jgi:purine-nucleoside phosphorylase